MIFCNENASEAILLKHIKELIKSLKYSTTILIGPSIEFLNTKQVLFPLSKKITKLEKFLIFFLDLKIPQRKTLILDLDETLIFTDKTLLESSETIYNFHKVNFLLFHEVKFFILR